jgi:hypothetical protein
MKGHHICSKQSLKPLSIGETAAIDRMTESEAFAVVPLSLAQFQRIRGKVQANLPLCPAGMDRADQERTVAVELAEIALR